MADSPYATTTLKDIQYQTAQLAYDQFCISLARSGNAPEITFDELQESHKHAWIEAVWVAVTAGKNKVSCDKVTKKELDNGYLVFAGAKEITKTHPGIYTYSKLSTPAKRAYRNLALRVYQVLDDQDDEERANGFQHPLDGTET